MNSLADSRFYALGPDRSAAVHAPYDTDISHFLKMAYQNVEPERRLLFDPNDEFVSLRVEEAFRNSPPLWTAQDTNFPRRVVVDYWGDLEKDASLPAHKIVSSPSAWVSPVVAYVKLVERYYGDEQPFRRDDRAWHRMHVPSQFQRLLRRAAHGSTAPLTNEGGFPQVELMELMVDEVFRHRGVGLVAVHAALWPLQDEATLYGRVASQGNLAEVYERYGMQRTGRAAFETGRHVVQLAGRVADIRQRIEERMSQKGIIPPSTTLQ